MVEQSWGGQNRDALRQRVAAAILEMLRIAEQLRDKAARQQGLHPTDFACISYLVAHGEPASPKQIIAQLGLTSGSGTALLDRLENANFIRRLPNPDDRRSVLVELNHEVAAAPIARYQKMQQAYRQVTDGFSSEELNVVARFIEQLGDKSIINADGDSEPARNVA